MEIYEASKMVKEILANFGEYYDPSPAWINGTDEPYLLHKQFGLELRKYWRSGYTYASYENITVFDESKGLLVPGDWQEVLKEYYGKLDIIVKNKRDEEARRKKCANVYSLIYGMVPYFSSECDKQISDSIRIVKTTGRDDSCHHFEFEHIKIYYNGEEVYWYEKHENVGNYEIPGEDIYYHKYIPGNWEKELEDIKRRNQTEVPKEKTLGHLVEIRMIQR